MPLGRKYYVVFFSLTALVATAPAFAEHAPKLLPDGSAPAQIIPTKDPVADPGPAVSPSPSPTPETEAEADNTANPEATSETARQLKARAVIKTRPPAWVPQEIMQKIWNQTSTKGLTAMVQKVLGRVPTPAEVKAVNGASNNIVFNQYRIFKALWKKQFGTEPTAKDIYYQFLKPNFEHYASFKSVENESVRLVLKNIAAVTRVDQNTLARIMAPNSAYHRELTREAAFDLFMRPVRVNLASSSPRRVRR